MEASIRSIQAWAAVGDVPQLLREHLPNRPWTSFGRHVNIVWITLQGSLDIISTSYHNEVLDKQYPKYRPASRWEGGAGGGVGGAPAPWGVARRGGPGGLVETKSYRGIAAGA